MLIEELLRDSGRNKAINSLYCDMFGFQIIERWDNPKQAFVGANDTVLGLMEAPGYDYGAYINAHLAFCCEEEAFPDVVAKVQGLGAEVEVDSGPRPQRGGETILFRDPSGNILEVCYPSIRGWVASKT